MRLATLGLLLLAAGASAQDARTAAFDGALDALDDTLTTGEAVDRYVFDVAAGEEVTVEMVSDAFDTWLVLKRPGAPNLDNDDWNGSRRVSRIVARADSAGTFEALATSYAPGMTGAYRITVSSVPPASVTASPRDADGFAGTVWAGRLPRRAGVSDLPLGSAPAARCARRSPRRPTLPRTLPRQAPRTAGSSPTARSSSRTAPRQCASR